jgi:hypoxanthine phosphoribosyltransferase
MEILITNNEITEICQNIGKEITSKFKNSAPIVVCILKGACPFHSELIKYIDLPIEIDYMQVSSYIGTKSSGKLNIKKDLETNIKNRDVIIVEDIVDSGLTLSNLKQMLEIRNPHSLTFVTLLDKPIKRKVEFTPDYVGKTIDDLFVIGFGLDLNEKYRNLKDICIIND